MANMTVWQTGIEYGFYEYSQTKVESLSQSAVARPTSSVHMAEVERSTKITFTRCGTLSYEMQNSPKAVYLLFVVYRGRCKSYRLLDSRHEICAPAEGCDIHHHRHALTKSTILFNQIKATHTASTDVRGSPLQGQRSSLVPPPQRMNSLKVTHLHLSNLNLIASVIRCSRRIGMKLASTIYGRNTRS